MHGKTLDDLLSAAIEEASRFDNADIALHYFAPNSWRAAAVNTCVHVVLGESDGVFEAIGQTAAEAIGALITKMRACSIDDAAALNERLRRER
ncbi:hypothetical protein [Methylocapsa aurea]|uniref:hypothetical protein n=1 Tax=Methylocapsa aurea TaxID=663610 RepID=UPI003D18D100